ncbi:MAG: sugar phosphate isomerase/epimerase [Clostridia bacterium]|nr:sugar phosphate isomerase/epimerase [Clostridia bacterium]
MKTSSWFNFHACPKTDMDAFLQEGILSHKRIGFDGINFDLCCVGALDESLDTRLERFLQLARENELEIPVAHLPFVTQKVGLPDDPAFQTKMYRAIDCAKMLGVGYAVVHPNSTTVPLEGYDRAAEFENVMGHLGPFVEYAKKQGVQIVIENMRIVHKGYPVHRFGASPEELCAVADALDIGICWDTGHANITGLKQSEALACVGSRLKMLHINDNMADDDIHLAPFCGNIDWADVMQGLKAIGFEGYLNFEVSTARVPHACREAYGNYVHSTAAALENLMK